MNAGLDAAIAKLKEKGEAAGVALTLEQSLEDDRAAIKADAIKRIMTRDGCAATPAEKVVETDADYFAHREKQRASIVARFRADAEYWAAKCEATQASLITPTMIELEAQLRTGQTAIDAATKAVDEATRVNAELFDTVSLLKNENVRLQGANVALVKANRDLAAFRAEGVIT